MLHRTVLGAGFAQAAEPSGHFRVAYCCSLARGCADFSIGSPLLQSPRAGPQHQHFFLEFVWLPCCLRLHQGALQEGDRRMMMKQKISVVSTSSAGGGHQLVRQSDLLRGGTWLHEGM